MMSKGQSSAKLGYRANGKVVILAKCRCIIENRRLLKDTHGLIFQQMNLDTALDIQSILNYLSGSVITEESFAYRETRTVPLANMEQNFVHSTMQAARQILRFLTKKYSADPFFLANNPDMITKTSSSSTSSTMLPSSNMTEDAEIPFEIVVPEPKHEKKRKRTSMTDLKWPVLKFSKTMTTRHNKHLPGTYDPYQMYCGRMAYKRRHHETKQDTFAYYASSGDAELSGWWIGPTLGGNEVYAYHPSTVACTPPKDKWNVPHDGTIDKRFRCRKSQSGRRPCEAEPFVDQFTQGR